MKIQICINKHLLLQKESPFIAQSFSNKKKLVQVHKFAVKNTHDGVVICSAVTFKTKAH